MNYFIKQKAFSWGDKISIFNEAGQEIYRVQGEVFTFGRRLHFLDTDGRELALIRQKPWAFMPRFIVEKNGTEILTVKREFTWFKPKYTVEGNGIDWTVSGDAWAHEYRITSSQGAVASLSKRFLSWGDAYDLSVADDMDPIAVLSVVIAIDAAVASSSNS